VWRGKGRQQGFQVVEGPTGARLGALWVASGAERSCVGEPADGAREALSRVQAAANRMPAPQTL
jgi:hypothetical protein